MEILLNKTVTLEFLFRRAPNFARLCLATKENFLALEKGRKLWFHSFLSQKLSLQWKIQKIHTWPDSAPITSAARDAATLNLTCSCLTHEIMYLHGLKTSESFLNLNSGANNLNVKNDVLGTFLNLMSSSQFYLPPKLIKSWHYSFQAVRHSKNGQS